MTAKQVEALYCKVKLVDRFRSYVVLSSRVRLPITDTLGQVLGGFNWHCAPSIKQTLHTAGARGGAHRGV